MRTNARAHYLKSYQFSYIYGPLHPPPSHPNTPLAIVTVDCRFPVPSRTYAFFGEFCDTKEFRWLEERDRELGKLQSKQETSHRSAGYPSCLQFWSWVLCCSRFQTTCSPTNGSILFFGSYQSICWLDVSMEIFLKTWENQRLHWLVLPRRQTNTRQSVRPSCTRMECKI